MQDLMQQPGPSQIGLGGGQHLQPSNSRESLPNERPAKKVQAFALTKKLNTKIQAVASKLTEIFVWKGTISESKLETLPLCVNVVMFYTLLGDIV